MNSFNEMCIRVSREIDTKSTRVRSRTEKELIRYQYAVRHLLTLDIIEEHLLYWDHYNYHYQSLSNALQEHSYSEV